MARSGISRKTAIDPVSNCSAVTTRAGTASPTVALCSLGQENKSCSEPTKETPSLFGGDHNIAPTNKQASNARFSETRASTFRQSLSVRQTRSLITAGLVRGITPSLVRQTSGLAIRDFASLPLDGGEPAKSPVGALSSSNASREAIRAALAAQGDQP